MSISELLKGASEAQDADAAQVFANVLNMDLHAMKTYNGHMNYTAQDTMRLARVLAEYERLNKSTMMGSTTTRVAPRLATGAAAAV